MNRVNIIPIPSEIAMHLLQIYVLKITEDNYLALNLH